MSDEKTIMTVSELQERLDEVIEDKLTVHITYDDSEEIVAVLMSIEDYEDMLNEINYLEKEVEQLQNRLV